MEISPSVRPPGRHHACGRITKLWALPSLGILLWVGWQASQTPCLSGGSVRKTVAAVGNGTRNGTSTAIRTVLASGDGYEIFTVVDDDDDYLTDAAGRKVGGYLLGPPGPIVAGLRERLERMASLVTGGGVPTTEEARAEASRRAYLDLVKSLVSGAAYLDSERSVSPGRGKVPVGAFNRDNREGGVDWAYLGDTMTGWKRLDNVRDLLSKAIEDDVPGDYVETGVWRGGSSVFARAVLRAYGEADDRKSYVCDSFKGLPPGDRDGLKDQRDMGWDSMPYLEVSDEIVVDAFRKYSLLDSNVVFVKGYFADSMAPLADEVMGPEGRKLAVMRLDGDMYQSTVDVLYRLYDRLSVGGYVIIDDWFGFPAQDACREFFEAHGINPEIVRIDRLSAYWRKVEDIEVQKWRYDQSKFKGHNSTVTN